MAALGGSPDPTWPDQDGPRQRFGERTARKGEGWAFYGALAWVAVSMAALTYLSVLSDQRLDLAQSRSGAPAFFVQPRVPQLVAFWVPTIAAIIVLNLRTAVVTKLTALALLFAAMMGWSAVAMTGYDLVTNDQVLIHSSLPWRRDIRFALADARVTAKGCHYRPTKSGADHRVIFDVQGAGQTIDLGEAAGRDLRRWLAVMRDYDTGSLPLAASAGANAPHDAECLRYWLSDLDPQQQAELAHLLS